MVPLRPTEIRFPIDVIKQEVDLAIRQIGFADGDHICLIHPDAIDQDPYRDSESKRKWPSGRRMSDYRYTNSSIGSASYLFHIWSSLRMGDLPVARMRIARIRPGRCYSWHNDEEIRYHFAVQTNPKSFFVISDLPRDSSNMPRYPELEFEMTQVQVYHVPDDGRMYELDSNHVHSAFNGGQTDRIHLVIETISALNDRPVP